MRSSKMLTSGEVAERLNVTIVTVQRYARDGTFPNATQLSGKNLWRIPESDVEALIERGR